MSTQRFPSRRLSWLLVSLTLLGASSAVWQAVVLREGLAISDDNEMTIAALLVVWMTLTAAGAFRGAKRAVQVTRGSLLRALLSLAVSMPVVLLIVRRAAGWLPPGSSASLWQVLVGSVLLLAPSCWLSGWLYAQLARPGWEEADENDIGKRVADADGEAAGGAYGVESLGAGVAGLVLGWLLLDRLLPMQVTALASGLTIVNAGLLARKKRRAAVVLPGLLAVGGLGLTPLDRLTLGWQLPGAQQVVSARSSERGLVLETVTNGQRQLLVNRVPVVVPSDHLAGDQFGLLVPALAPRRAHVVWLGVPPGDTLVKLLSYDVQVVDVVVGDPSWTQPMRQFCPGGAEHRVRWHGDDERGWLRNVAPRSIDLLVMDTPTPTTLAGARMFSLEVFEQVKRVLRPSGVVVVSMPGHSAYASVAQQYLHATVATTLGAAFEHVLPVPLDHTLYVASSGPLPSSNRLVSVLRSRMDEAGQRPSVVDVSWVRDKLSSERMADATKWASRSAPVSRDDVPAVQSAALRAWSSSMDPSARQVLLVLLGLLVLGIVVAEFPGRRPVRTAAMTTGFAGMSLQLVVMAVVQIAVGALYRDVASLTGAFLLASFFGALWGRAQGMSQGRLVWLEVVQAIMAGTLALVIPTLLHTSPQSARHVALLSVALVGFGGGAQIAAASRWLGVFRADIAGTLYAADLLGAAAAALLTYVWILPVWGLTGVAWSVVMVKLASAVSLGVNDAELSDPPQRGRWPVAAVIVTFALILLQSDVLAERVEQITLGRGYAWLVWVVLVVSLAGTLEPRFWRRWWVSLERRVRTFSAHLGMPPWRLLSVLVLLPVAVLPINRCYYRVPFVFCHVCPRPCAFGVLRPVVVTSAVLANLSGHRFCERVCPLGQAQLSLGLSRMRSPLGLSWLTRPLQLAALVLVVYVYFDAVGTVPGRGESWAQVLSSEQYVRQVGTLAVAGVLMVLSFWVRRPFCSALCPIGATARLTDKLLGWVSRAGRAEPFEPSLSDDPVGGRRQP